MKQILVVLMIQALLLPLGRADTLLSDPMRPPGKTVLSGKRLQAPGDPKWRLTSTLISEDRKVASINNRLLVVGDRISGAEVLSIDSGEVRLGYRGKIILVKLITKNIRQ